MNMCCRRRYIFHRKHGHKMMYICSSITSNALERRGMTSSELASASMHVLVTTWIPERAILFDRPMHFSNRIQLQDFVCLTCRAPQRNSAALPGLHICGVYDIASLVSVPRIGLYFLTVSGSPRQTLSKNVAIDAILRRFSKRAAHIRSICTH